MSIPVWLRTPRVRRGLAASAIVLSAGGLVLFRAPVSGHLPTVTEAAASPTGVNTASFSGPGGHGSVALSHSKVLAGSGERFFAEVKLVADKGEQAPAHAPVSLVVVLDTSGSMSGEKIVRAKESVVRLLREMDSEDEVAVVRYSDDADVIQGLARVGSVRESVIARVQELGAGGGTAIPRGLARGLGELGLAGSGRVRRVVLVSDGLDSTRVEAERMASDSFEHGITISSMGIGLDFDESYMGGVARAGHGNFGFVKDASALATFLRRELTETSSTTIENATVRIALPRGVTLAQSSNSDARMDGDDVEVKLGSLFAGDERRVVLELASSLKDGDAKDLVARARWDRVGGGSADVTAPKLTVVATRDPVEVDRGRDATVLASATSVLASTRQMEAAEAYNAGDVEKAQRLIDKNIADLKAAAVNAPAPAASALDSQWQSYGATKSGFLHAPPQSAAGKVAAKRAVERDSANMQKSAF